MTVPMDAAEVRAGLLARRSELAALSEHSAEARLPVTLDQQVLGRLSRIDAIQQQELQQAFDRHRHRELRRIDAALKRLDEGEYGTCLRCGEDIPTARLRLDLATPLCVTCAEPGKHAC